MDDFAIDRENTMSQRKDIPRPRNKRAGAWRRRGLLALMSLSLVCAWRMHKLPTAHAQAMLDHFYAGSEPASRALAREPQRVVAEGRLVARPGAEVTLGCEIGGRILRIMVEEKMMVHKGDLIAELEPSEQAAAVREAKSKLGEIQADIELAQERFDRVNDRLPGAVSGDEISARRHALESAKARREIVAASVDRLESILAKTRIYSPIDGTVTARFAQPGQIVDPLTRIATIANLNQTRLEAEVNEFDAPRVFIGAEATITAEGYPGKHWRAKVEEIPDQVVARQLRPQDAGRPSDTGVVVVKLTAVDPVPFRLGQRVDFVIHSSTADQEALAR
jgi:HlyD family secretion protein